MRYASLAGRLIIVGPGVTAVDVESASEGKFPSDPQAIYAHWDEFRSWASELDLTQAQPFKLVDLGPPVPLPRQLFAIGLNYRSHADEVGQSSNDVPPVFTKFVSSITGPYAEVVHPGGSVDWEVELVVVIGREARRVTAAEALDHVAGLTVGQDLSERETQHQGTVPQFSLGKSFPGFAPMGPWVVTLDEFTNPEDLELECWVNGDLVQNARTSEMILSVSQLIARLSNVTPLLPGDVIYTGTPAGVGMGRTPPRFLGVGDSLRTRIDGIGELHTSIVAQEAS